MIDEPKFDMHEAYCRRNIRKCDKCDEMIDKNEIETHEEEFHKAVTCDLCSANFEASKLESHKKACPQRKITCQYCSLEYPFKEISSHSNACGSRTNNCQFCGKIVQLRELEVHEINCPEEMRKEKAKLQAEADRKRREDAKRREELLLREQEYEEKKRKEAIMLEEQRRKEQKLLKEEQERKKMELEVKRLEEEKKRASAGYGNYGNSGTPTLARANTGSSYGASRGAAALKPEPQYTSNVGRTNPTPAQPTKTSSGYTTGLPSKTPAASNSGISARVASNVLPGTKVTNDRHVASSTNNTNPKPTTRTTPSSWQEPPKTQPASKPSATNHRETKPSPNAAMFGGYPDSLSLAASRAGDARGYTPAYSDDDEYARQLHAELNRDKLSNDELLARKLQEELDAQMAEELSKQIEGGTYNSNVRANSTNDEWGSSGYDAGYNPPRSQPRSTPDYSDYSAGFGGANNFDDPYEPNYGTRGYEPVPSNYGPKRTTTGYSNYEDIDEDAESQLAILESMKAQQTATAGSNRPGSRRTGDPYARPR